MNANSTKNPYPWLTGPISEVDLSAWDTYVKALREQIGFDWARAKKAYLGLKNVRESLGLPFIDTAPKTEAGGPDPSAWTPDLETQSQDLQAMVTLITTALDDVVAGKRKLMWDQKGYFVVEALPGDVVRLELDTQGVPQIVDASTGKPTHVTSTLGVPNIVWAAAATATVSVLALPAYFVADAAVNGLRVVAEQRTARVLGERAFDCVQSGKCTPEQAAAVAKAPYEGAAAVRAEAAKEAASKGKETSDLMKAVTTIAWVALGLGVIYAAVRFIPPMGKMSAPLLPAHSPNPNPLRGFSPVLRGFSDAPGGVQARFEDGFVVNLHTAHGMARVYALRPYDPSDPLRRPAKAVWQKYQRVAIESFLSGRDAKIWKDRDGDLVADLRAAA